MSEIFDYGNLNEREFFKLIRLQGYFLAKITEKEWQNYQKSLKIINENEQIRIEWHRKNLINQIDDKIEEIKIKEMWNYGAIRLKDVYWRPHHFTLLPIIYKDYRKFSVRDIKSLCSGESVSAYLFKTYPYLKETLANIWYNYCEYRKELKRNKLNIKLGYAEDLPKEEFIPSGFSLSTIAELLSEIKNKSFEKYKRDDEVTKMFSEGKKQEEIAEKLKISQGFVSKILHSKDSFFNYDMYESETKTQNKIDNNIKFFFEIIMS